MEKNTRITHVAVNRNMRPASLTAVSGNASQRPEGPFYNEIGRLEALIESFVGLIANLEVRLEPVPSEENGAASTERPMPTPPCTPLAAVLYERNNRLFELRERVEQLQGRIQI